MEKKQFLTLVKNFTSITSEELNDLLVIQELFPYSQVIHNLSSRASSDNEFLRKEELLHDSAIYTTDRSILKSIMTAPSRQRSEFIVEAVNEKVNNSEFEVPVVDDELKTIGNEEILDRIFEDLERLKKSKEFYESSMEKLEKLDLEKPSIKSESTLIEHNVGVEKSDWKSEKSEEANDEKQKEQLEIIEKFIKIQPGIARTKAEVVSTDNSDLTEKSTHFADNVISETLVEILIKQGKKTKAIEVLKKLIWKFPQKKAYFAAQIEELKK